MQPIYIRVFKLNFSILQPKLTPGLDLYSLSWTQLESNYFSVMSSLVIDHTLFPRRGRATREVRPHRNRQETFGGWVHVIIPPCEGNIQMEYERSRTVSVLVLYLQVDSLHGKRGRVDQMDGPIAIFQVPRCNYLVGKCISCQNGNEQKYK